MSFQWKKKRKVQNPINVFAQASGKTADEHGNYSSSENEDERYLKHKKSKGDDNDAKNNLTIQEFNDIKNKAVSLAEQHKFREAISQFQKITTKINVITAGVEQLEVAKIYEMIAQSYIELGEFLNACNAGDECVKLEPSWLQGRLTRGRARLEFGEIEGAKKDFLRVVEDCEISQNNNKKNDELNKSTKQEAEQELVRIEEIFKKIQNKKTGAVVNDRIVNLNFWEQAQKVEYGADGRVEEESMRDSILNNSSGSSSHRQNFVADEIQPEMEGSPEKIVKVNKVPEDSEEIGSLEVEEGKKCKVFDLKRTRSRSRSRSRK